MHEVSKPQDQAAAEVHELCELFRALRIGQTIPYADITAKTRIDVQSPRGRHRWARARRSMWASRIYLSVIRDVGIQRIASASAVGVVEGDMVAVRKRAKRTRVRAAQVDIADLDRREVHRLAAVSAMAGLVANSTSTATREQLRLAAAKTGGLLVPDNKQIMRGILSAMGGE